MFGKKIYAILFISLFSSVMQNNAMEEGSSKARFLELRDEFSRCLRGGVDDSREADERPARQPARQPLSVLDAQVGSGPAGNFVDQLRRRVDQFRRRRVPEETEEPVREFNRDEVLREKEAVAERRLREQEHRQAALDAQRAEGCVDDLNNVLRKRRDANMDDEEAGANNAGNGNAAAAPGAGQRPGSIRGSAAFNVMNSLFPQVPRGANVNNGARHNARNDNEGQQRRGSVHDLPAFDAMENLFPQVARGAGNNSENGGQQLPQNDQQNNQPAESAADANEPQPAQQSGDNYPANNPVNNNDGNNKSLLAKVFTSKVVIPGVIGGLFAMYKLYQYLTTTELQWNVQALNELKSLIRERETVKNFDRKFNALASRITLLDRQVLEDHYNAGLYTGLDAHIDDNLMSSVEDAYVAKNTAQKMVAQKMNNLKCGLSNDWVQLRSFADDVKSAVKSSASRVKVACSS